MLHYNEHNKSSCSTLDTAKTLLRFCMLDLNHDENTRCRFPKHDQDINGCYKYEDQNYFDFLDMGVLSFASQFAANLMYHKST